MSKNSKFILPVILILLLLPACHAGRSLSTEGLLTVIDLRLLSPFFESSEKTESLETFLNASFIEYPDSSIPYQICKSQTPRLIEGKEFQNRCVLVDGRLDSILYVSIEPFSDEDEAYLLTLMENCQAEYGNTTTYIGNHSRLSDNIQNLEKHHTYVETWEKGNIECKINVSLVEENDQTMIWIQILYQKFGKSERVN